MPNPRRPRAVTAPVRLEDTMTERQWAAAVEGLLSFYGWRWHHSPDNKPNQRGGKQRVGDRGFPDYCAVRRLDAWATDGQPWPVAELAFLELKTTTGRLGPGQPEWLEDLGAVAEAVVHPAYTPPRLIVGVFRPRDRRDLEELLAGPRGRDVYLGRDGAGL